ncbi:hypothetical protein [Nannocystis exedens]|uniref:hypothetical protein n=1 Tax=Nannocystis exedens TaxID=54 RepID=UPI0011602F19|nr:hypothetical protein [Nannocystis exedens]
MYYGLFASEARLPGYVTVLEAFAERGAERVPVLALETVNVPDGALDYGSLSSGKASNFRHEPVDTLPATGLRGSYAAPLDRRRHALLVPRSHRARQQVHPRWPSPAEP